MPEDIALVTVVSTAMTDSTSRIHHARNVRFIARNARGLPIVHSVFRVDMAAYVIGSAGTLVHNARTFLFVRNASLVVSVRIVNFIAH